jgi:hypothetical protein
VQTCDRQRHPLGAWITRLEQRMHRNKVTVALANKIAVEVPECTRAPQKISRLLLYRTATWLDYEERVYSIYARRLALLTCVPPRPWRKAQHHRRPVFLIASATCRISLGWNGWSLTQPNLI